MYAALILALGLLAAPLAVKAQQAGKVYRIGILSPAGRPSPSAPGTANRVPMALRELGYVEGQNLVVERRFAEGKIDRLSALARELVGLRVDVIVAVSAGAAQAAKEATKTIPIVMLGSDPVGRGFVASLARPGGNITGVALAPETELVSKRLQLIKEAVPRVPRIAVLTTDEPATKTQVEKARQAATHRIPAIFDWRENADEGGLMAYGSNGAALNRRVAEYVDKILKGAKPADLPVEQPAKFELVINLKTAKTLGLTIPPSVLLRADEVIQ